MKTRRLRWALAGVGALAAIAIPLVTLAYPKYGWDRVYYDDAAHTNEVGEQTLYCNGHPHMWWGTSSPYFDETLIDCHDPPDPYNP
ncbi:MAG: hypothetical protein JF570_11695 [Caulobacter sp.]|nr:hypothetical protein [Caulobacter sp.]